MLRPVVPLLSLSASTRREGEVEPAARAPSLRSSGGLARARICLDGEGPCALLSEALAGAVPGRPGARQRAVCGTPTGRAHFWQASQIDRDMAVRAARERVVGRRLCAAAGVAAPDSLWGSPMAGVLWDGRWGLPGFANRPRRDRNEVICETGEAMVHYSAVVPAGVPDPERQGRGWEGWRGVRDFGLPESRRRLQLLKPRGGD